MVREQDDEPPNESKASSAPPLISAGIASSGNINSTNRIDNNAFSFLMKSKVERNRYLAASAPPLRRLSHEVLDRRSRFIAHTARIRTRREVLAVQAVLATVPLFASATHNIHAWRFLKPVSGRDGSRPDDYIVDDGWEDDGEDGAGRRLWVALRDAGACDCIVVVSRWYGGTNLGPVRFEHISNLGVAAVLDAGIIAPKAGAAASDAATSQAAGAQLALIGQPQSEGGVQAERDRTLRLIKARTGSLQGYIKAIAKCEAQIEANQQVISVLGAKVAKDSGIEAVSLEIPPKYQAPHIPTNSTTTTTATTSTAAASTEGTNAIPDIASTMATVEEMHQTLNEREQWLQVAKTALTRAQACVEQQDAAITRLSLAVASSGRRRGTG
ncbi:hypothetical protein HDU84_008814 [Entophlyctis sp. JEL0112]|nr:hypothetical protein HDU84_008814 [Entophlyctis sp. JEL0112]